MGQGRDRARQGQSGDRAGTGRGQDGGRAGTEKGNTDNLTQHVFGLLGHFKIKIIMKPVPDKCRASRWYGYVCDCSDLSW